jgi:hypothetical protein
MNTASSTKGDHPHCTSQMIPRHAYWRRRYREHRYLEHLTENELLQRAKDLLGNQLTLTNDLKIGFYDFTHDSDYLLMAWTHVLEEFVLRGYRPPSPFKGNLDDIQIPKYDWPGVRKAIKQIRSIKYSKDGALFKYGSKKYLQRMVESGSIRIAAAASYDDPSLNPAIRDSELEISLISLPSEVHLEAYDGKTGQKKGTIIPVGNLKWTRKAGTNFYVYCLASRFDPRMFGDFEADGCVVIKNPVRFVERFRLSGIGVFPNGTA